MTLSELCVAAVVLLASVWVCLLCWEHCGWLRLSQCDFRSRASVAVVEFNLGLNSAPPDWPTFWWTCSKRPHAMCLKVSLTLQDVSICAKFSLTSGPHRICACRFKWFPQSNMFINILPNLIILPLNTFYYGFWTILYQNELKKNNSAESNWALTFTSFKENIFPQLYRKWFVVIDHYSLLV